MGKKSALHHGSSYLWCGNSDRLLLSQIWKQCECIHDRQYSINNLESYPYRQATVVISHIVNESVCVVMGVRIPLGIVVPVWILQVPLVIANSLVVVLVVSAAHHKTLAIVCCLKLKSQTVQLHCLNIARIANAVQVTI